MDLLATVTEKQAVDVWRFNGQRVFGLAPDGENETLIEGLAWRSDGQLLAVARSNGVVQLINSFSGKIAHRFDSSSSATASVHSFSSSRQSATSSSPPSQPSVSSISWTTQFANPTSTRRHLDDTGGFIVLDHLLGLNADIPRLLKNKADLPKELASIDVETSLPKLAILPATGSDDDVFSSRISIDSIFHSQNVSNGQGKGKGDTVDVLVVGLSNATAHIRIFDSFEIGSIDISEALPKDLVGRKIVKQTSHPFLSTHFVLVEATPKPASKQPSSTQMSHYLVSLDMRFIPQTAHNLPLLATKATQLQNLLRYITQIKIQMTQEVKSAFDLPARFLRNVNESLAEHDKNASFATAAYHLVVTGECDPRLKEWLVDEVGERGLKRWEKAVGDCLDMVRRMTSECLLPALERCQVVLSRLDGLARFPNTATRLGLEEKGIVAVRETIDALMILGEDLLKDVCIEIREFAAFMRWFKWEAEVEALEIDSERAEDLRETYAGESELRTVLDYISGSLQESRILRYIDTNAGDTSEIKTTSESGDVQFFADYKKRRNNKDKQLPKLRALLSRLKNRSDKVFAQIAERLRQSILVGRVTELPTDFDPSAVDMRILPAVDNKDNYKLHIVSQRKDNRDCVAYITINFVGESGKGLRKVSENIHTLMLPPEADLIDAKLADDEGLLVLARTTEEQHILWHSIYKEGGAEMEDEDWELRHIFDQGLMKGGMKPEMLTINGRKGRRAVAVQDEIGKGYVILELDSGVIDLNATEASGRDEVMTG